MDARPGVSLAEVMVATVLLAVGVTGCVAALLGAARLRLESSAREDVVDAVDRRLSWFESDGCGDADTVVVAVGDVDERWIVSRTDSSARLDGRALRRLASRTIRLPLRAQRECR